MPVAKLTIQYIQNAKPEAKKETIVRDADIVGFSLKITPTGSKVFFFQYRLGGRSGVTRRITIGKFPSVKPDDARKIAFSYASDVAKKIDPAERLKNEVNAKKKSRENSFPRIFEIYKEKHLSRNRSGKDITALFERVFIPAFKNTPISSITRSDIKDVVDKTCKNVGGYAGNKALSVIKTFFHWAYVGDYISNDPASAVQKPFEEEKSRERVLSSIEIKELWARFGKVDCKPFGSALKLLLILGQRRNEVGHMRWEDINFENSTWLIPQEISKNKKSHLLPLPKQAIDIIEAQPKLIKQDKDNKKRTPSKYVFTTNGLTPISGWSKIKEQLDKSIPDSSKKNINLKDWRVHDLRRTVATNLGDLGYSDHEIGMLLNHARRGVTSIYNRSDNLEKKEKMLTDWQDRLNLILNI